MTARATAAPLLAGRERAYAGPRPLDVGAEEAHERAIESMQEHGRALDGTHEMPRLLHREPFGLLVAMHGN